MNQNHISTRQKMFRVSMWFGLLTVTVLGLYLMTAHQSHVFTVLAWVFLVAIVGMPLVLFLMRLSNQRAFGDQESRKASDQKTGRLS
jgi:hypothetical protein